MDTAFSVEEDGDVISRCLVGRFECAEGVRLLLFTDVFFHGRRCGRGKVHSLAFLVQVAQYSGQSLQLFGRARDAVLQLPRRTRQLGSPFRQDLRRVCLNQRTEGARQGEGDAGIDTRLLFAGRFTSA